MSNVVQIMGLFLVGRYYAFCARTLMRSVAVVVQKCLSWLAWPGLLANHKPTTVHSLATGKTDCLPLLFYFVFFRRTFTFLEAACWARPDGHFD
jgi:hypothetical protein